MSSADSSREDQGSLDEYLDRALESAFFALEDVPEEPEARASEPLRDPERVDRYVIEDVLGRGGMGDVYAGIDPALGRLLAIKVLSPRVSADVEVGDFLEEARLCSQLQHPGVVPIHEIGHTEDGRPFFTMKIIDGETLLTRLRRRANPLEEQRRFLKWFEAVCQTVAFAHERGVLHRDIKSGNVMIGAFGEVLVVDWGLACWVDRVRATGASAIAGTPTNMAPEQARGEPLTKAADVFSLGAILCEILTGTTPYTGESRSEVFLRASQAWLDDARERLAACGADASLVVLTESCLHVDAKERPADARVLAERLHACLDAIDQRSRDLEVAAAEARAKAVEERRARRLTLALAAVLIVLVCVAAGTWIFIENDRAARRAADEQSVVQAVQRAEALRDAALRSEVPDLAAWQAAKIAAQQAQSFLAKHQVTPVLAARVGDVTAAIEAGRATALRDHEMVRWLREIRPHLGNDRGHAHTDEAYARAFREYGLDLDSEQADVDALAAGIRGSVISTDLATALDDWVLQRRRRGLDTWKKLVRVAELADADPVRRRVMQALGATDAKALRALAKEAAEGSWSALNYDLLGKCLAAFGLNKDCVRVYRRAHLLHPGDFNIAHNLGGRLLFERRVQWQEILRLFAVAVASRPRSPHALADLGRAYVDTKQFALAREVLERARGIDASYPRTWLYLGLVYDRLERHGDARTALQEAVRLVPSHYEANRNLALVHLRLGELSAAEKAFQKTAALAGPRARAWALHLLGQVQIERGQLEHAMETLRRAAEAKESDARIAYDLGRAYHRGSRLGLARAAFQKATELMAEFPEAWCNLGHVLIDLGEFESGRKALEKGHTLGSKSKKWSYPSALWVQRAKYLEGLAVELSSFLASGAATTAGRTAGFAEVALRRGQLRAAVRLYAEAFGEKPGLADVRAPSLRFAATMGALELGFSGQADAARHREQAKEWFASELASIEAAIQRGDSAAALREEIDRWRWHPQTQKLAAARPDAVPAGEWAAWQGLWRRLTTARQGLDR